MEQTLLAIPLGDTSINLRNGLPAVSSELDRQQDLQCKVPTYHNKMSNIGSCEHFMMKTTAFATSDV